MIPFAEDSPFNKIEWITTGISSLDRILGGGVPTKRITEISGPFSVGKSTLAFMVVANAQKEKRKTLWADVEWSFEKDYPKVLGVDLKKLQLIQEKTAEVVLDSIEEWAETNENGLIVLDSVGALHSRQEAEKDADSKVIGVQAGLVARFCRKIVPILVVNNHALIVLNHEFTDIMSGRIMTSGGKKLEHHKSIWLKLKKLLKNIKKGDRVVGELIQAEIRKNKLVPTMRQTCELTLIFGSGYSAEADLFNELLEKGEITKIGQKFFRGEKYLGRGINAAREALKNG